MLEVSFAVKDICNFCIKYLEYYSYVVGLSYAEINVLWFMILMPSFITFFISTEVLEFIFRKREKIVKAIKISKLIMIVAIVLYVIHVLYVTVTNELISVSMYDTILKSHMYD